MADNKWRLSWYWVPGMGDFELHSPWWVSGTRMSDDAETVVACVIASSEDSAKELIFRAYDTRPSDIEWRFCGEMTDDQSPFSGRFPQAKWMQWPQGEKAGNTQSNG
jgi:hypothetical protein